jgi:hypothetical protein
MSGGGTPLTYLLMLLFARSWGKYFIFDMTGLLNRGEVSTQLGLICSFGFLLLLLCKMLAVFPLRWLTFACIHIWFLRLGWWNFYGVVQKLIDDNVGCSFNYMLTSHFGFNENRSSLGMNLHASCVEL